ncbi:MAG: Na+/H+ antiporter NhaC family protein [Candidatus Babeliales bacterium]
MQSWLVLLPPLLVLSLAIITRQVLTSLIVGIISAGLIVTHFSFIPTLQLLGLRLWQELSDPLNIYTFGFLIFLGMLITLISITGGATAYGNAIKKLLRTPRSTKISTIILSFLFMIDDFFSSLTVGCIMKPLMDNFKIPRAKLAFLIDSLASPLVIIMPISTWIAMLLMQLNKAGISLDKADKPIILADPFLTYLKSIPFIFYSFAVIASVWVIVGFSISFGRMKKHEQIAAQTGNLFGGKSPLPEMQTEACGMQGHVIDFILPIGSLILFIIFGILYSGNSVLLGGTNALLKTIQQADIFLALFLGCLASLILNLIQMMVRGLVSFKSLNTLFKGGWNLMGDSIIILLLAFTFSTMLKSDLKTGQYIATILIGSMPGFLLPCMFFLASLATSVATGSSWGTIAVMIPIAIPMIGSFFNITLYADPATLNFLYPIIGSIFAGAVAGDHVSPIATTTVMSATSAGCYLDDHVYTQLPYALPALLSTVIAYFVSGLLIPFGYWIAAIIPLILAIGISQIILLTIHYLQKKA